MADIPLRTYVQQLDNLIERKQVDEVIAHCRHILGLYPKHLDTYRMLGKALLEKGRHGDAADIFQRVLSVMPDDFISHVGMSIVREDETNLDSAIWHMERAFEAAPANGAIQQELCRLFGRRDGVAPTKARLTRGALARMYAQGGLYLQAEAELKAALAAENDRIDLMTKLAEVYWQTDQPAQAAQTSADILQKLPYSLEANRILANVFRAQGRANDAAVNRQRLEALDPYEAFADPAANGAGAGQVDPAKVVVARLEYVPGMEDSGSPDWLASIGAKFEDSTNRSGEAQPEWLSTGGEKAQSAADYQPGQSSAPDWLKDLDSGPAGAAATTAQMSEPPDWLKDISSAPAQPAVPAGESSEGLPDWLVSATGPLPADSVPDWMLQTSVPSTIGFDEAGTAPLAEASSPATYQASAKAQGSETARSGSDTTAPLPPLEPAGAVPDWLKATVADENQEELPDWLKAITAQPMPEAQAQPPNPAPVATPVATPLAVPAETMPAWIQDTAPVELAAPAEPAASTDHVPDWLQEAASTPTGTGPLPDWLKVATGELNPDKVAHLLPPEPPVAEIEAPTLPTTPEPAVAATEAASTMPMTDDASPTSLGDLPDWLKGAATLGEAALTAAASTATESPVADAAKKPAAAEALEPGTALPEWLKEAAPSAASLPAASQAWEPTSQEAALMPLGDDELPDWLQTAAATPAAQDETPVWLQTAPAGPSLVEPQAEPQDEMEIPDWMKELSAGATPASIEAASTAPVDLPDFLKLASPEAIARSEQPLELEPETAPAEEEPTAEALPADIPDWLKALAPVESEAMAPTPLSADEAVPAEVGAAAETAGSLDWMDELTALSAPSGETPSSEPAADATPAWLAAPAAETEPATPETANVIAGGLAEDTLTAEIPPWAQNDEPGPTDTIVSWLAGKHVPDWLRQPANEAPGLPAVEWEPTAAEAAASAAEAVDATNRLEAAPEEHAPAELNIAAEPSAETETPDLAAMDPEEAFRWLESLAAQQGAKPEELFTAPATASAEPAAPVLGVAGLEPAIAEQQPVMAEQQSPALAVAEQAPAAVPEEPNDLEAFLQQNEAALPVEHLVDTAPSKPKSASDTVAEPVAEELDTDAALAWLEGLAAQQGAKPEELLTAPEDRTLKAPEWVVAEQAAATDEPQPSLASPDAMVEAVISEVEVEVPATAEMTASAPAAELTETVEATAEAVEATPRAPVAESLLPDTAAQDAAAEDAEAEAAMRRLEGLAAQQGANPEELLTAPEDRTLEAPTWVSAEAAEATTAAAEASPFEAVPPAAEPEAEPEPAQPEPEPAIAPETPQWLAAQPVDEQTTPSKETASVEPSTPEPAPATTRAPVGATADLDKLSRLAERLSTQRKAREAEMEARFAKQRNQQEAARRWMEQQMETKRAEPAPRGTAELSGPPAVSKAPVTAAAEPVATPAATPSVAPVTAEATPAEISTPEPAQAQVPAPAEASVPVVTSTAPPAASAEALAHGQAALAGQDYAAAVRHLSPLVEQGHHLDTVVQALEGANAGGAAPAPMLRLLGDAYVRTDQLQKALDSYRQALRRL